MANEYRAKSFADAFRMARKDIGGGGASGLDPPKWHTHDIQHEPQRRDPSKLVCIFPSSF